MLGSLLFHATLLCDDDPGSSRRDLAEASREFLVLAGTLPRRAVGSWLRRARSLLLPRP